MEHRWLERGLFALTILAGLLVIFDMTSTVAASPVKLEVLNPRGEVLAPGGAPISPRLSTLMGKKIGILCNEKAGAVKFEPFIEKALKERVTPLELKRWSLGYTRWPGREDRVRAIAAGSDAVVALIGD